MQTFNSAPARRQARNASPPARPSSAPARNTGVAQKPPMHSSGTSARSTGTPSLIAISTGIKPGKV